MRFMRVWLTAACVACTIAIGAADASAAQKKPKNATAQCVDGTYSMARSQQGACSSHGGIKTWYAETKAEARDDKAETKVAKTQQKAERKVARTEQKTERKIDRTEEKIDRTEDRISRRRVGTPATATARCNDGTYSYAAQHSGACSSHGGVAEWYR